MSKPALVLRPATHADLPALLALEARFPGDRMSARQFRRHLRSVTARLHVAELEGVVRGASLLFFRAGSDGVRLYSLVVDAAARGHGLGQRLLVDAETAAHRRGCTRMRLEVRADNAVANALYQRAGYQQVARLPGYYEDGADGLRYQRTLG